MPGREVCRISNWHSFLSKPLATTLTVVYSPEKSYSKVTLDINVKCKKHRGGKMKNLLDVYFVTGLVTSLKTNACARETS